MNDPQDVLHLPSLERLLYGLTSAVDGFTEAQSRCIAAKVAKSFLPTLRNAVRAEETAFLARKKKAKGAEA